MEVTQDQLDLIDQLTEDTARELFTNQRSKTYWNIVSWIDHLVKAGTITLNMEQLRFVFFHNKVYRKGKLGYEAALRRWHQEDEPIEILS